MANDIHCQSFNSLKLKYDTKGEAQNNLNEIRLSSSTQQNFLRQNKYSSKFMRLLYIAIASIIASIIIVIIVTTSYKNTNKYCTVHSLTNVSESVSTDFSNALVLTCENHSLCTLDPRNFKYNHLHGINSNVNTFDLYPKNGLIWVEENITKIQSNSIDDLNITYFEKITPQALAVDFVTEKLYIIDKVSRTLNIIDLRYKYYGIALSDLIRPYDIVLDLEEGIMFILQLWHSVLRANMDASLTKNIIENDKISAMAINRKTKRIYWVKSGKYKSIESSNYEGENRLSLTPISTDTLSLALLNGQLFWLSHDLTNKSYIYSCTIREWNCENHTSRELPFKSTIIKSFPKQYFTSVKNPCKKENGNCEHLCLLGLYGSSSCTCKLGWKWHKYLKTCEHIVDFLLYAQGDFFRGRTLDDNQETFVDVISPTRFFVKSLNHKSTIDFDQSWIHNEIFFCDDYSIYSLNIDDGQQSKVFEVENGYYIDNLAVDWISRNLYYFKMSNHNYDHTVQAISIKRGRIFEKTIAFNFSNHTRGFDTQTLAVKPQLGKLKFSTLRNPHLLESNLNGDNFKIGSVWMSSSVNPVGSFIFDFDDQINSPALFISCPTDDPDFILKIRKMCVYQEWKFFNNFTSIWRTNKLVDKDLKRIVPKTEDSLNQTIAGVKIFRSIINISESEKRCAVNNGGCEQFCFIKPENSCGCEDGSKLLGKQCS